MALDLMTIMLDFLAQYGLIAVFILLLLDGAMMMPVLPGEIVMVMAVTTYATTPMDLVGLIALATLAAILGSLLLYTIMRKGGRRLVESHPRLFMMDKRKRHKLERSFQKPSGQMLVFFLRLIPLTRVIVNIPAGLAKMRLGRFLVLSSLGLALFHAGFMWFAYEFRRPDSQVAQTAAQLQEAYANPAMDYMQANQAISGLVVLAIGAVLSYRSSATTIREPEYPATSLIGWLAARILFWGSIIAGGLLLWRPELLYDLALSGGLDLLAIAARLDIDPLSLYGIVATAGVTIGFVLVIMGKAAKRKAKRADAELKKRAKEEEAIKKSLEAQAERDRLKANAPTRLVKFDDTDDEDGAAPGPRGG